MRAMVRRLVWTVAVVWFALSATFAIATLMPADPARAAAGPAADAEAVAHLRAAMCLDRSLFVQYGCFVGRIARGDLGTSFRTGRPIARLLRERAGPTLELAGAALALQLLFGLPLGALAAFRRGRAADGIVRALAALGQALPVFVVGPVAMAFFAYRLEWLPVSGYGEGGWDRLRHLVLPAGTLALGGAAAWARLLRGELLEVLGQPYIRTARAKGLGPLRVALRHALVPALAPLFGLIAVELGALAGGAILVESIFAWPGLGREAVLAILNLDLPVVLGVVLVSAVAVALAGLGAELLHALCDPRLRSAEGRARSLPKPPA